MLAQVYFRRRYGRRLARLDEANQVALVGMLHYCTVTYGSEHINQITLSPQGNTRSDARQAILYEPVLIGMGAWWIVFRGYEVVETSAGRTSYVQEWRCYVGGMMPGMAAAQTKTPANNTGANGPTGEVQ